MAIDRHRPEGSPPATDPGDRIFCSRPFKWFEISRGKEESEVFACCPTWLPKPIGNLARQSVAEVWNGETAQELRRSIHDGSFRYCNAQNCPHLQNISDPVQRVRDIVDPDLLAAIEDELVVLPHGPREINCSFDRSCNLSCPTCRQEVIMEHARADEIMLIRQKINDDALRDAHMLYITGSGDPFGSPFFRNWLHAMKRDDMPLLDTIHLHSNGQLWNERTWMLIAPEIRALVKSADISIDAARPEIYAINRRGGEMERLLLNLDYIAGLRRDGPLEWLGVNMVVQANNFREMADFVALGKHAAADMVYFHRLVNWGTFTEEEFAERAVHLPDHPLHAEFLEVLARPVFDDPVVYMSNLAELR